MRYKFFTPFHTPFCIILLCHLTHWGQVTHICVVDLTIIGSDNGLSPGRRQAIIWTNAGILLFGPLGTKFSELLIEIHTFSFKKIHLKMSSGKWRPFCLGLNELIHWGQVTHVWVNALTHHWFRQWVGGCLMNLWLTVTSWHGHEFRITDPHKGPLWGKSTGSYLLMIWWRVNFSEFFPTTFSKL